MDFLKAEIARKKNQMEQSQVMQPDKTYFKRGDLAAKQAEEYWKKHKRMRLADQEGQSGSASENDTDSPGLADDTVPRSRKTHIPPRKEVIKRLRERGEPIIMFGETEAEAYGRLRKLEMSQPEINKGFKNDFQSAMERVDEEYLHELMKSTGEKSGSSGNVTVKDEGVTAEEIQEMAKKMGQGDTNIDQEVILQFLKLVLKCWGEELNSRPEEVKRSFKGKLASATHSQTVEYIKPLFKNLKQKVTKADILDCLVDVVKNLIDRDYLRANDAYLEMAIGNAPWPIGVTMVGIHARTGREKIFARNVAHVLNDETQRKYIQALKRLMTQCQKYFPTDPSRSVNYEPAS